MSKEAKLFSPADTLDALAGIRSLMEAIFMMASHLHDQQEANAFQAVTGTALDRMQDLSGYLEECRRQEGV